MNPEKSEIKLEDRKEISAEQAEKILDNLHPDFKIKAGQWRYNRDIGILRAYIDRKLRIGFDDPKLLDDCPFTGKIGINLDEAIECSNIGIIYGTERDKDNLVDWGQKFPYCELIEDLDRNGASTPDSKISIINKNNQDNK